MIVVSVVIFLFLMHVRSALVKPSQSSADQGASSFLATVPSGWSYHPGSS